MDLLWIMFSFFILVTAIFVVIGIFFPEWVGITGQKAHEIQRHQQEENPEKAKLPESIDLEKK